MCLCAPPPTHTHLLAPSYATIYIYMCVCVCVCVFIIIAVLRTCGAQGGGGGGAELFPCPYPPKDQARPPRDQRPAPWSRVSGQGRLTRFFTRHTFYTSMTISPTHTPTQTPPHPHFEIPSYDPVILFVTSYHKMFHFGCRHHISRLLVTEMPLKSQEVYK